jgi:hypothetical protein
MSRGGTKTSSTWWTSRRRSRPLAPTPARRTLRGHGQGRQRAARRTSTGRSALTCWTSRSGARPARSRTKRVDRQGSELFSRSCIRYERWNCATLVEHLAVYGRWSEIRATTRKRSTCYGCLSRTSWPTGMCAPTRETTAVLQTLQAHAAGTSDARRAQGEVHRADGRSRSRRACPAR